MSIAKYNEEVAGVPRVGHIMDLFFEKMQKNTKKVHFFIKKFCHVKKK